MPLPTPPSPPSTWRAPVEPVAIVRRYDPGLAYAAGGHRGVDLRAARGAEVRSPCAGRVTFRGRVAGGPPTVTVDCGALRATLQRVEPTVAVAQGVGRGAVLGRATGDAVDLSARRPDGSYRDPAPLLELGGERVPPPLVTPKRPSARPRPATTRPQTHRPVRFADRALVKPKGAVPPATVTPGAANTPDGVVGLTGLAVMGGVALAWIRSARRTGRHAGRRRTGSVTRAVVARVQR